MRKLLLIGLIVLALVELVPAIVGAMSIECEAAADAGWLNVRKNIQCLFWLIEQALNPDLCPMCTA